uniref:DNA mismatch repair protein n=1 Tax=Albugo laibachii Nc14 TaxID=890382 RepID=F0WNK0_9STRA|nr:PREDICTED: similar to G/T mismatch binding protein p [Albugo laibachii Nc14]|eukprot:CCA22891.1 PREDICTED: similar to G/T mismatch binding protein p [Albugo laibachii Nc14]
MKQTQQSLLTFFSPSSAKSPPNTIEKKKINAVNSSKKRISFSKKISAAVDEDAEEPKHKKRKKHEQFLGTSSEEEGLPVVNHINQKDERTSGKNKNRKRSVAILEDDSSSEDELMASNGDDDFDLDYTEDKHVVSSREDSSEADLDEEELKDTFVVQKDPSQKHSILKQGVDKSGPVSQVATPKAIPQQPASGVFGSGCHIHDSLVWLKTERCDIDGNRPDSSNYDPRTLYVPPNFLKKETPAMIQWWEVKSRNMDTVLFFKVGKFYELFHMDADVGFKELNLIYMKGEKAHSGFPEIAHDKMASQLVQKGYRVARVEQTETPEMMKIRNANSKQKSKVVRREICSMVSPGLNSFGCLLSDDPCTRMLVLKEVQTKQGSALVPRYGVCVLDTPTACFQLGEFNDTVQRDRLKTLLAQYRIVEFICERSETAKATKQIIKFGAPDAVITELKSGSEFWSASKTVQEIQNAQYFTNSGWPSSIAQYLTSENLVEIDGELALSALGGCIWQLRRGIVDKELLSMCNFKNYIPSDQQVRSSCQGTAVQMGTPELNQRYAVLDSQTLSNLEILRNNRNGKRNGSLINILDKTATSFGKRLFQEWVVKPLCQVADITDRLDAVQELMANMETVTQIRNCFKKLPDLERVLFRIHTLGSADRARDHPDSRAIMYESNTYNIRKIRDFVAALNGFESAMDLIEAITPIFAQFESSLLRNIVQKSDSDGETERSAGQFPDLRKRLEFFKVSFDRESAQKSGVIIPETGVDPEYDAACIDIQRVEKALEEYLEEQKKILRCQQISYWGKKKDDRYQLEIPEEAITSKQPKEYELKSRRKGFKRFHTPKIRKLLAELTRTEEKREEALKDQMRRIFHKFDENHIEWVQAVRFLAVLDCYQSLAVVSAHSENYSRPLVMSAKSNDGIPFIDFKGGVHATMAGNEHFIPNDTTLGLDGRGSLMLLSGPNMGGKSTLLRQTCLIALMAQIGCFVPATNCRMSPFDRIFTRIGATDNLLAGQSTLYVELAETATILNHSTQHSLVILDELGRGTSTFDGTAIASSVVEYLLRRVGCRSMFATHYHSLVEEYQNDSKVALSHMACMIDPKEEHKVTFLYKLSPGMCPRSYGTNVAILAQLPEQVIQCAIAKSKQFELSLQNYAKSFAETSHLHAQVESLMRTPEPQMDVLLSLWQEARKMASTLCTR